MRGRAAAVTFTIAGAVIVIGMRFAAVDVAAAARFVTLRTSDGVSLTATYYEPTRRPTPAIIFVHMLARTRDDWHNAASRMVDAGFAALTFDLRGHGSSTGSAEDVTKMTLDVAAARAFLAGHAEVQAIGMVGASVGANIAVLAAAEDPSVRSIALLSPGVDYRGLRLESAMKKYGDRPALLVAGSNDPYALRSSKELAAFGTGLREIRRLDAQGHGTTLLVRAPDLMGTLVDWFRQTLL
jgi:pimeloyl-ACP methyl ester carboxylesterase